MHDFRWRAKDTQEKLLTCLEKLGSRICFYAVRVASNLALGEY